jgi:hypothetical protein
LVQGHETFDIIIEEGVNELVVDIKIYNSTCEDGNTHSKEEHFSLNLQNMKIKI